jgi:hypothetical protein
MRFEHPGGDGGAASITFAVGKTLMEKGRKFVAVGVRASADMNDEIPF